MPINQRRELLASTSLRAWAVPLMLTGGLVLLTACAEDGSVALADAAAPAGQAQAAENPCAAANPCAATNPCAAACGPCGPCGPCGAAPVVELTEAQARAAYDCLLPEMTEAYGRFEEVGTMPTGSILAKDSFVAHPDGGLSVGPLFIMERLAPSESPDTAGWAYRMVMPNGAVDRSAGTQAFCAECHAQMADFQDSLFFLPPDLRIGG